jgi:hypothetical protein
VSAAVKEKVPEIKVPETYYATIRAEIVKPLGTDWDTLGRQLRSLSMPLHRVYNKAISELELMHTGRLLGLEDGNERTILYQLVRDYWRIEREAAEDRVASGKSYHGDEDIATIAPASSAVLGAANAVWSKWKRYDDVRWKGTATLSTFGKGQPIEISSSSEAVRVSIEDGAIVLDLRLVADAPHTRLVIRPNGGAHYGELRRAAADPNLIGNCKLIYEKARGSGDRHEKWQALIAVQRTARPVTGKSVMAIHRGLRTFLVAAIAGDDRKDALTMVLADGGDIVEHKRAYAARRASVGRHQRERGSGARGHGQDRRFEAVTRLKDKESNWVKTKCQQLAARVMHLAKKRGIAKILVEDWSNPARDGALGLDEHVEKLVRQFPLGALKDSIAWAAKGAGIEFSEVPTCGNSKRCPNCGHAHVVAQHPIFECEKCQLKRPVEMTFPWNMLVDHAGASGKELVKANNRAIKRARGRMIGK